MTEKELIDQMVDSLTPAERSQYEEMLAKIGPIRMTGWAVQSSPAKSRSRITS